MLSDGEVSSGVEERPLPVKIFELEETVVPDNSFEGAYAIYLRLSCAPPLEWEDAFGRLLEQEGRRRIVSFIGSKMRVVISPRDNLKAVLRQMEDLARRTNVLLDFTGEA